MRNGFTIIEILISIAILTIIFALGLMMTMDTYHGYSRRSERDTVVAVLERARSHALGNVLQNVWGACFSGSTYVIFRGQSYSSGVADVTIPANHSVTIADTSAVKKFACSNGGIVFMQLTGDASSTSMTITQGAITAHVSTNLEGTIVW